MKTKTSDLTGYALDWAVAKAEVQEPVGSFLDGVVAHPDYNKFYPSTDWSQGGLIIEREKLETRHDGRQSWCAWIGGVGAVHGPTPLVAAMRCFVASRLGDEVDIPEELL